MLTCFLQNLQICKKREKCALLGGIAGISRILYANIV